MKSLRMHCPNPITRSGQVSLVLEMFTPGDLFHFIALVATSVSTTVATAVATAVATTVATAITICFLICHIIQSIRQASHRTAMHFLYRPPQSRDCQCDVSALSSVAVQLVCLLDGNVQGFYLQSRLHAQ